MPVPWPFGYVAVSSCEYRTESANEKAVNRWAPFDSLIFIQYLQCNKVVIFAKAKMLGFFVAFYNPFRSKMEAGVFSWLEASGSLL